MFGFINNLPVLFICFVLTSTSVGCGSHVTFSDYAKSISGKKNQSEELSSAQVQTAESSREKLSLNPGCLKPGNRTLKLSGVSGYSLNNLEVPDICLMNLDPEIRGYSRPVLNLAFVIDISGSMDESLEGVQNSISFLAKILDMKGWKASYLGVAFKDEVWKTIETDSSLEFVSELKSLKAEGGGADHPQEAGFLAIQKALSLFSERQSPGNRNVMFYVSNAPAWFRDDQNFQPDSLVESVRNSEAVANLSIDFFYSVPNNEQHAEFSKIPKMQMESLVSNLSWTSESLRYPLSQQAILEPFVEKIPEPGTPSTLSCRLKSVELQAGQELISLFDNEKMSLAEGTNWKSQVDLSISGGYELSIKRCCAENGDQSGSCFSEPSASLVFEMMDGLPRKEI